MEILTPGIGLLLYSFITLVVVVVLFVLLLRWVFRVNTMVRLQQQQLDLLKEIAVKQGIEPEVITSILNRPQN